ncbi:UNVERIFIED_CONTAM: hypothetical protein K2H54_049297 [Gekko kuhli]
MPISQAGNTENECLLLTASNASGHFLALPKSPPQPPSSPCSSPCSSRRGRRHHSQFLMAVLRACREQGRGRSRALPFPKEAVMRQLKEIMLDSFFELEPKFIIAMRAVEELSKFQPPLQPELKTSIVAWALGLVLSGSPGPEDPAQQALQQQGEVGLQRMLLALLMEDPSAGHWLALLETIVEDPAFGGLVAKLAVSLADPDAGVREKAREVIGQLLQLLLCQQGLKGEKKRRSTIKWEEDPERPWRESYLHLTSVAEVFRGHLSPGQGLSLQHIALEDALNLARPWVREGGLVLLYTHLGQAHGLLEEEEVEDLRHSLSALLYNLWWGGEVPAEIRALLPRTGNLPFLGNGGGGGATALEPREELKLFVIFTIH